MNDDLDMIEHDDNLGAEANDRELAEMDYDDPNEAEGVPDVFDQMRDGDTEPDDEALVGSLLAQCSYLVNDLAQPETVAILADADRDDLARTCATFDEMINLLATAHDDVAQQLAHLMEDDTEAIAGMTVTRNRSSKTEWDKENVVRAVRGVILDRWVIDQPTDRQAELARFLERVSQDFYTAYSVTPLVTGLKALTINPNEFRAVTHATRWSVKVKGQ